MDRRGFLRFLGLGAAAVVAPTKAYSFLGGILRPRKPDFTINRHTYEMLERQINPPLWTYELQGSNDLVNWTSSFDAPAFKVAPITGGVWDGLSIVTKDDILDIGGLKQLPQRYLRVVCTGGPMEDVQRFSITPKT